MAEKVLPKSIPKRWNVLENTFHSFLASEAFKQSLIDFVCHSYEWHQQHQSLHIEFLPGGKWRIWDGWTHHPRGCIMVLTQINYHPDCMAIIRDMRNFLDLIVEDVDEARCVAERLYLAQEQWLRERAIAQFTYMRENGLS